MATQQTNGKKYHKLLNELYIALEHKKLFQKKYNAFYKCYDDKCSFLDNEDNFNSFMVYLDIENVSGKTQRQYEKIRIILGLDEIITLHDKHINQNIINVLNDKCSKPFMVRNLYISSQNENITIKSLSIECLDFLKEYKP